MQFDHKDIDYFASALLLFNLVLLLTIIAQCCIRSILDICYSDITLICIAVASALLTTNKVSINAASRIIHKIFGFNG